MQSILDKYIDERDFTSPYRKPTVPQLPLGTGSAYTPAQVRADGTKILPGDPDYRIYQEDILNPSPLPLPKPGDSPTPIAPAPVGRDALSPYIGANGLISPRVLTRLFRGNEPDIIDPPFPTTPTTVAPNPAVPTPTPAPAPVVPDAPSISPSNPHELNSYQEAARDMARQRAQQYFIQQGLNPADYADAIEQQLRSITDTFTEETNPEGQFAANIGDMAFNAETNRRRNQYTQQADQQFGSNYGQRSIGSSLLDDAINEILGTQQTDAQRYLDRGLARGMFNEVGYNAGRDAINTQASAARAQLGNTASDIIDRYRGEANAIRDNAYDAASGYTLGRQFSLDPYITEAQEVINRANTSGVGELRSTIGNTNFFNMQGITNRAGSAQGAQNLLNTDVATALGERRRRGQDRGLGSQGVF
jgi:hypothetical protein